MNPRNRTGWRELGLVLALCLGACRSPGPTTARRIQEPADPRLRTSDWFDPADLAIFGNSWGRLVYAPDPDLGEPPLWARREFRSRTFFCAMPVGPGPVFGSWGEDEDPQGHMSNYLRRRHGLQSLLARLEEMPWLEGRVLALPAGSRDGQSYRRVWIDLGAEHGLRLGDVVYFDRRGFGGGRGEITELEPRRSEVMSTIGAPRRLGDLVYPVPLQWRHRDTAAIEAYHYALEDLRRRLLSVERGLARLTEADFPAARTE